MPPGALTLQQRVSADRGAMQKNYRIARADFFKSFDDCL